MVSISAFKIIHVSLFSSIILIICIAVLTQDFLDLDDDSDNSGLDLPTEKGKQGSADLPTEKEKQGKSTVDTKALAAEVGTLVNHTGSSSETKSPTSSSLLKEAANTKEKNAPTLAEKDSSFTFPVTPTSSTITHLNSATQAPLFPNGVCSPKELTPAPVFGSGSNSTEKAGPFKFSLQTSAVNKSVDPIFSSQSDSKLTKNRSVLFSILEFFVYFIYLLEVQLCIYFSFSFYYL